MSVRRLISTLVITTATALVAVPQIPLAASPETKAERDARMAWWREARFGMFIHWGLYAVPAGEYKGQRSKEIGEWISVREHPARRVRAVRRRSSTR